MLAWGKLGLRSLHSLPIQGSPTPLSPLSHCSASKRRQQGGHSRQARASDTGLTTPYFQPTALAPSQPQPSQTFMSQPSPVRSSPPLDQYQGSGASSPLPSGMLRSEETHPLNPSKSVPLPFYQAAMQQGASQLLHEVWAHCPYARCLPAHLPASPSYSEALCKLCLPCLPRRPRIKPTGRLGRDSTGGAGCRTRRPSTTAMTLGTRGA